jgi:Mg2+ and Co2+ transporter CorA
MKSVSVKTPFSTGSNNLINQKLKVRTIARIHQGFELNVCLSSVGHAVVEMSTKDFFTWLQQAETEVEEGEEEGN